MPRHPMAINPPTSLQPAACEPLPSPRRRAEGTHGRGEGGTEARGRRSSGGRIPRFLVCFPLLVLSADGRRASGATLQQLAQLDANCVLAAAGASGCRGCSSHTTSQVMHVLHGCHVMGCKTGAHGSPMLSDKKKTARPIVLSTRQQQHLEGCRGGNLSACICMDGYS
ncbi:hypothetical protein Q5P01_008568 [Channa striata]|uniref:Uncharacterized protein n=1 Tax=Channa striata TaxID=64152 RepID=A0AA88SWM1_CHASR|nr:hypothetical protein Q5P01_008568 [Channa striata]